MMRPNELLRRAAAIIAAGGWSAGAVARDGTGWPTALYRGERAAINPEAVSFSVYGAVCKALNEGRGCSHAPLLWDVLSRQAGAANGAVQGGTNHLHPIIQFNETPGRTQAEVLALLEAAAAECEQIGGVPFPLPAGADPKQLEAL